MVDTSETIEATLPKIRRIREEIYYNPNRILELIPEGHILALAVLPETMANNNGHTFGAVTCLIEHGTMFKDFYDSLQKHLASRVLVLFASTDTASAETDGTCPLEAITCLEGLPPEKVLATIINEDMASLMIGPLGEHGNPVEFSELDLLQFVLAQSSENYIPVVSSNGSIVQTPEDQKKWRIDVQAMYKMMNLPSKQLMDAVETIPFISSVMNSPAFISEGWRLRTHIGMVLAMCESFFKDQEIVISSEALKLAFLLHDIGKPLAYARRGTTDSQHFYNEVIGGAVLQRFVGQKLLLDQELAIVHNLIQQDHIGHLLNPKYGDYNKNADRIAHEICKDAQALGIPPTEYFTLLQVFFICDAGSYGGYVPFDGIQPKEPFNHLFETSEDGGLIDFTGAAKETVVRLKQQIEGLTTTSYA